MLTSAHLFHDIIVPLAQSLHDPEFPFRRRQAYAVCPSRHGLTRARVSTYQTVISIDRVLLVLRSSVSASLMKAFSWVDLQIADL